MKMFRFVKKMKPYLSAYKKQLIFFVSIIVVSLVLDIVKIFWNVDLMEFDANTPTIKIATLIAGIAIFSVIINICNFVSQMILSFVVINVFEKVRKDIYKHITNLRVDLLKTGIEGDFLIRWTIDLQMAQNAFMNNITPLIISPIGTVLYTIYLAMKRWDLLLVSMLPVIFTLFATNKYGKYFAKKVSEMLKEQAKLNDMIKDSVVCIQIVKIYMLLKSLTNKYIKINLKRTKVEEHIKKANIINTGILYLMCFDIGGIMCYAYGGYLCYLNKMDLVSLFIFRFIFSALINCVTTLPNVITEFRTNILHINRVFDIFDYPIEQIGEAQLNDISCDNCIEFNNVSFSYDKQSVLKDCSFEIKKGEKVAVVGENCKTTILNLICGFYALNCGSISVLGYYVNETNLKYIRSKIAAVLQEPTVFLGNIKENIVCEYKYDAEKFERATSLSIVSKFVKKFPNEYNTHIDGQGGILSGGQAQRLNLARALYKDSEILLLDNYTSALDNDTKRDLYRNMNTIKDKTIIVFSNSVYDLEQVDRVILLKDGQVYMQGKHKDLLKECMYYKEILNKNSVKE